VRVVEGVASVEDVDAFVADLAAVGDDHGAAVQVFDARLVADRDHLAAAVERADRAFDRGENVARDRAVEILLYAAGRRQINRALEMGVSAGETPVAVVVHGGDEDAAAEAVADLLEPEPTLGDARDEDAIREFFGVSEAEREASSAGLSLLVRERVALLDVEK
jgi:KEOPS complex subunit Cgi121